jgi:cystathionine beta-lyase/cystathionine gamma-synthase
MFRRDNQQRKRMKKRNVFGFSTKAVHAGQRPDPTTGAVMTPVYLTSTYVQEEIGKHKGYEYSRVSNPTRTALEENVAALENGRYGAAFASGMAAIDAIMYLLKPGDHAVMSRNVYGGTYRAAKFVYEQYGITFSFVDTTDLDAIKDAIGKQTRMLFIETPTNPTMEITDLQAAATLARKRKVISVVDNTFATPYLQKPLDFGIDIVVHSATKYLNGHSDMLGGLVVTNSDTIIESIRFTQKAIGGILSPFDSWLCLRGTKTLAVRMDRHNENAGKVALFLTNHPAVGKVYYPGLPNHPQHELARRQMTGFGGMIAFDVGSFKKANRILKKVRICSLAESLGGVETLISHPASMTHASVPQKEREAFGITEGLVRISVGIEDADDIIADLSNALG